jgi:hypothetical protein
MSATNPVYLICPSALFASVPSVLRICLLQTLSIWFVRLPFLHLFHQYYAYVCYKLCLFDLSVCPFCICSISTSHMSATNSVYLICPSALFASVPSLLRICLLQSLCLCALSVCPFCICSISTKHVSAIGSLLLCLYIHTFFLSVMSVLSPCLQYLLWLSVYLYLFSYPYFLSIFFHWSVYLYLFYQYYSFICSSFCLFTLSVCVPIFAL